MKNLLLSVLGTSLLATAAVHAAEHTVEMKNVGADGPMVFVPGVLQVAVGDTVKFVATDMAAHNSESIDDLKPEGSVSWKGGANKEVSVTIDKEGVYVYKCQPHSVAGMVGVLVAGEPTNIDEIKEKSSALSSTSPLIKGRLDNYLAQVSN
ncbi:MAG: pseudoazurin [Pseudomonadota bacterium]